MTLCPVAAGIRELEPWYHSFDLPGGSTTRGYFDLRKVPARIPLPDSLAGKRCLDAAACDGFWSFELARRGAAEVVSLDLPSTTQMDWNGLPSQEAASSGSGLSTRHFNFVREALGMEGMERVEMNLYDASVEALGSFDYVFVGNVLIHLADPARALKALRPLIRPGGELLSLEANSTFLSLMSPRLPLGQLWEGEPQPRWWLPNRAAHRQLLRAAGFEVLGQGGPVFQPFGKGFRPWHKSIPRSPRELQHWILIRPFGPASGWVRGRPSA